LLPLVLPPPLRLCLFPCLSSRRSSIALCAVPTIQGGI
jgi:hypothetical protein